MPDVFRKVLVTEDFHTYLKTTGHVLLPLVERLIDRIEQFILRNHGITGPHIRRLESNLYKARLSYDLRIPFTIKVEGDALDLHLGDVGSHAEGDSWHRNPPSFDARVVLENLESPETLEITTSERSPHHMVCRVRRYESTWFDRLAHNPEASLRLSLSPQQDAFARLQGPILLRGGAGSGKTTVALYRMLLDERPAGDRLYVTFTPQLKRHAEQLYAELAVPGVPSPRFLTIEELCREILGPDARTLFPPEQRMTGARFRALYSRHQAFLGKNPETILEDILGAIKCDERLLFTPDRAWLTRSEYLESKRRLAEDGEQVYREFEQYRQLDATWDDADLARAAWWRVRQHSGGIRNYSEVVVDEVQDLTAFHLALLMLLAESPGGLFLAGDTQQSIHPSRFEWIHTRTLFHAVLGQALGGDTVRTLTTNHRSPGSVVRLMNAITGWRQATWADDTSFEVSTNRDERPLWRLTPSQITVLPEPEQLSTRLMVIVADEVTQIEARKRFGEALVYTVHEAKGLESEYVLLWGLLDHDRVVWEREDPREDRFRMRINRLTVALTRCLDELFVVDDYVPTRWSPWASGAWQEGDEAIQALARVLKVAPEDAAAIALKAENNEARGNLIQAAALYLRIDRPLDAARCHEGLENWREAARCHDRGGGHHGAARCLERAGLWTEAAQQYQKAGAPLEAARCLTQAGQHAQALKLYAAEGAWELVARCHEQLRQWSEAARFYCRAGLPGDQGRMLLKGRAYEDALSVFREIGDSRGEAQALEGLDELEPAIDAYRVAEDWVSVARLALSLGWPLDGAEAHALAGNHGAAARVYADIGEWAQASHQFREARQLVQAAWCLEQIEAWRDAARTYEEAAIEGALEVAERKGRLASVPPDPETVAPIVGLACIESDAWLTGFVHASRCFGKARMGPAERRCRLQQEALSGRNWKSLALELERGHRWYEASCFHRATGNLVRTAWCLEEGSSFIEAASAWQESRHARDQERCLKLALLSDSGDLMAMGAVCRAHGQFDRALVHYLGARSLEDILDVYLEAIVRHIASTRSYDDHVTADMNLRSQIFELWAAQIPRQTRDFLLNRRKDGFIVASWLAEAMDLENPVPWLRELDRLARTGAWSTLMGQLETRRPHQYAHLLKHLVDGQSVSAFQVLKAEP